MAWPARERPLAAAVVVTGAVVLGVLIAQGTRDLVLGVAAPVFVLASLGSFLLPTEYRLTKDAVEVRSLGVARVRPWTEVRRVDNEGPGSVLLSPFETRSWLDSYRGLRLLCGGNRDRVLAFVEARVGEARRDAAGGGAGGSADGPGAVRDAGDAGRPDAGG
jgi:hypothetical protein